MGGPIWKPIGLCERCSGGEFQESDTFSRGLHITAGCCRRQPVRKEGVDCLNLRCLKLSAGLFSL